MSELENISVVLAWNPIHYWIRLLCREPRALGKGLKALGKYFAEGQKRPRQSLRRRRKTSILTSSLPRAMLAGSRQRFFIFFKKSLCREPDIQALGKAVVLLNPAFYLCRVPAIHALGKAENLVFFSVFYLFFTCTATYVYIYHKSLCLYHNPHIYHT